MTEMTPEVEQYYRASAELLVRALPVFEDAHSFVMMTVLSALTARWILSHPEEHRDRLLIAFNDTVDESIANLLQHGVSEVRH